RVARGPAAAEAGRKRGQDAVRLGSACPASLPADLRKVASAGQADRSLESGTMELTLVLCWLLVVTLVLVGLAGAVLPAIPGVPLVFAGLWLGAWIDGYAQVSGWTVGVLGVLTLLAMAVDLVASAL